MNLRIDLPDEIVEEITAEATRRVLAELNRPAADISPYLTVPEAADLLRCSRQRVDDLLSSGRLSRVKEGRRTLIYRKEIDWHLREAR